MEKAKTSKITLGESFQESLDIINRVLAANVRGQRVSKDAAIEAKQHWHVLFGRDDDPEAKSLILDLQNKAVDIERERNIKIANHFGCSQVAKWIERKDDPI